MSLRKISTYYHTVKHLKVKQIFYRLYYRIQTIYISYPDVKLGHLTWQAPLISPSHLSSNTEFTFLQKSGNFKKSSIWNNSDYSKLWLYNLHYFDELNCKTSDTNTELLNDYISQWIQFNPPPLGNGWEPYPLSLRIVNWIKWFSRHPNLTKEQYTQNLHLQVSILEQRIEYHILGNHLFANGKALIFAGCFFKGSHAERWLKKGLKIINAEIKKQFLDDGGHFELSPMYHASMLWDLCDLINLSKQFLPLKASIMWEKTLVNGLRWLSKMIHPDGEISFFNDATLNNAPTYADIKKYANVLNINYHPPELSSFPSIYHLKSSGYCIINLPNNSKAILDTAKIGPSYQPGHAHADTLSFELSLFGERFIVNSGISQYGKDITRQLQRGTCAHNTVCIDNQNSSEVWGGFRVGKRAKPLYTNTYIDKDQILVESAHDGFRYLPGKNLHKRAWIFENNIIIIRDQITGEFIEATAHLHFHPKTKLLQKHDTELECYLSNHKKINIKFEGAKSISLENNFWYPGFGVEIPNVSCKIVFFENILNTQIMFNT